VDVTASAPGLDTLTATALGLTATQDMNVSDDSFALTAPLAGDEIVLNTIAQIDLTWTWTIAGVPQAGQLISFGSTRGTLSALVAATNAAGIATVTITSTNAGPAVITATNAAGTSTSVQVEFVADTPDSIDVQANPFTLGPGEQSAITAVVRDAANNLVKNAVVLFDLQDVTGGQLSAPSAVTDSQGRAQTFYTASSTTSANGGVVITGTVQSNPLINNSVALTVAKRELFISIGTGNSIFEPNTAQYRVEFAIQVRGPCADEDVNRNGVLDAGEDFNNSGRIEAGNIATVVAQNGSGGNFVTDAAGFGIVDVIYAQDHARWVEVTLEATTSVQGTEFAKASNFVLPINGDDVDSENEAPPGVISPFGSSASCADTL